jgi:hypothetical protein
MSQSLPVVPAVAIHGNVVPVSGLLGTWNGSGTGSYPTITGFTYDEELVFANTGRPFVSYTQRTWLGGSDRARPMHEENGFLRFVGAGKVEALITQCTGVQEILAGEWSKDESSQAVTITLDSTGLTRTPSAGQPFVTQVRRVYKFDLDGEGLEYTVSMATNNTPELTVHLKGKHSRAIPKPIAADDEAEEEQLEETLMEPDVARHATHDHTNSK